MHKWAPYAQLAVGAWLVAGAWTFGYGGRPEAWSDLASGILLMGLAMLSLRPPVPSMGPTAQWATASVGVWLMFSPLLFWADSAAAYVNATLAGSLAITFSILLPRHAIEYKGSAEVEIPAGWSYNPSAWSQRAPIIAMAFLGFFIAQYLAAFQLGYHDAPWDPFFGDGTRRVLTSDVSKAFPVSDAGLGAMAYLIEALTGFAGAKSRWRTMPWMVLFFGVLVVPAGVVSILLIILQPLAVGAWCGFCLLTAVTTLLMISPAADEVVATLQYLGQRRRAGASLWRTLWFGGPAEVIGQSGSLEGQAHGAVERHGVRAWFATALGLSTFTPTLVASAALGGWMMAAPVLLGSTGAAAASDQLVGPVVITVSIIAWAEIGRMVRWLNIPLGLWLLAAPWILDGASGAGRWNSVAVGLVLIALTAPRGRIEGRFGGFQRYVV